jgi:hypothetical protein
LVGFIVSDIEEVSGGGNATGGDGGAALEIEDDRRARMETQAALEAKDDELAEMETRTALEVEDD